MDELAGNGAEPVTFEDGGREYLATESKAFLTSTKRRIPDSRASRRDRITDLTTCTAWEHPRALMDPNCCGRRAGVWRARIMCDSTFEAMFVITGR